MIKNIIAFFIAMMGVLGIVAAIVVSVPGYIDDRIERKINDEEFIRMVSSHVRPFLIFDENESILMDGGAMQYLEKIEVKHEVDKKQSYPDFKIIVTPKHSLSIAPLIEILSKYELVIITERGKGHQWIYNMGVASILEEDDDGKKTPARFRLEILK